MVNVDISNIWCSVSLPNLLESEQEIAAAHAALMDRPGSSFLSWLDGDNDAELERLRETAEAIRASSQVLVVVGCDSAVQGAQAVLELLRGRDHNLRPGLQVLFAGSDLSTQSWQAMAESLEGRDFSVQAIGRDGTDLPAAVALRALRWLLERRYGTEKARERVYVTTDPTRGVLRKISAEEGYTAFNLPRTLAGHASALAPAALLAPLAAGVDAGKILEGAVQARRAMEIRSFENPAWLYAAGRMILGRKGKKVEYLTAAEPDAAALGRWWQRLFGARGCLGGDGLLPATAEIPAAFGQMWGIFSDSAEPLVQTVVRFDPPEQKTAVEMDWNNVDGLNYLEGFTLDYVQEQAVSGVIQAGVDGGVPLFTVDCGPLDELAAGGLLYFFELSSCLCAGMMGRDVYEDEPAASWKENMEKLLGKPED